MSRSAKTNSRTARLSMGEHTLVSGQKRLAIAIAAAAAMLTAPSVRAADLYWAVGGTAGGSGTWDNSTVSNWSTSGASQLSGLSAARPAAPPGSGDVAIFNVPGLNAVETISLAGNQAAQGLIFANTSATTLQASAGTGPVTLTVGNGGIQSSGAGGTNGGAAAVTFGSSTLANGMNVAVNGSQSWANDTGNLWTFLNGISNANSTAATLTINNYVSTTATSGDIFNGVISNGAGQLGLIVASGTAGLVTLAAANTYTGNTTVQGGNLTLDFSQATSPTTNIVSASSALVLGGGTTFTVGGVANSPALVLKGASGATNSETFNGTTLSGGAPVITLTQNSAASVTAALGSITRSAASTLNFSVIPSTSGVIATTTNSNEANGSGILGTWATVGTTTTLQYATVNGSNQIVAYNGATADAGNLASLTSASTNYSSSGANTLTASATGNTLRYTGGSSTTALGANTLALNGLQQAGTAALTISATTGGKIIVGSDNELVLTGNATAMTINAPIVNSTAGTSGVTYATGGVTTIGGANTYTGTTTINNGFVLVNVADVAGTSGAFGVGGNITFNGGVLQFASAAAAASDYSSRFKNSTSAIGVDMDLAGRRGVIWNGVIDSSNTGGMEIRSQSTTPYSTLTINGSNSYSGTTLLETPLNLILGNSAALGTSSVIGNASADISASTDLTGANALANNIYSNSNLGFEGIHSIQIAGVLGDSVATGSNKSIANNIAVGSLIISGRLNESATVNGINNLYFTGIGNTNITGVFANDATNTGAPSGLIDVNSGVLTLSGSNTYNGGTSLFGATLKLDFSAAGAPVTNIIAPSVTGFQLSLNNGTLNLVGAAGVANSQTEAQGLALGAGASQVVLAPGGVLSSIAGQLVFNAGGINAAVGSTLNITLSGASSATNGFTSSTSNDTYNLLKHVTVGLNDWGTKSGTNVVAYPAASYSDQGAVGSWLANKNITNTTSGPFTGTLGSALTIGSLRFNNNVAGGPDLGGNALTVGDGVLVTSNVVGQALTINDGQIQPTGATDLILINNGTGGTTLNVGATIQNNGATLGAVTKAGAGVVILSGNNTYTGATYVGQGVLQATDSVNLAGTVTGNTSSGTTVVNVSSVTNMSVGQAVFGTNIPIGDTIATVGSTSVTLATAATGSTAALSQLISFGSVTAGGLGQGLLVLNGGVLGLTSNFTRSFGTTFGQFQLTSSTAGFSDLGSSAVTVNFGGATPALPFVFGTGLGGISTQSWGTNGYGSTMILGSSSDTNTVNVVNPLDFGSLSRTFEVDKGAATIDGELSGVLSGASNVSGMIKTGQGTLLITANETYIGTTVVLAGTLTEGGQGVLASNSLLTVDGSTAVFDLGASHNNTVSTVVLDGGGSITGTGSSTLTSPVLDFRSGTVTAGLAGSGTALNKSTAGVVTLSGSNTYTGGTNVSTGSLVLNSANAFPANSSLTVASGASVTIANHSSSATFVPQLSLLLNTGTINVTNNAFLVHNGAVNTINAQVAQAFANGAWTGVPANSSTGVITSSLAAADTSHLTAVGVATGITTFQSATVAATDVLVKYTYFGDANLDGKVDGSDYSLIDSNFAGGATLTGWYNGDFNYDGILNGSDYTLIDNAFNTQGAQINAQFATATAEIGGGSASAVPEPTTLSLLGIGAFGLLGRRRRAR